MEFNKDIDLRILRSYMVSTKTKLDIIERAGKDDIKQYEITVHGIKGSSRGICAEEIGNKAYELEKAAERKDIDYIEKNNPVFLQELKTLLDSLEEMFNEIDSKTVKQKKDKPDKEVLKKLLEACDIYDMMEVEAAVKEISAYQYEIDNDLADWLKKKSEEMSYDEITEKLRKLLPDTI